ncbi:MAG: 2-oxo acid dehydrogenase subunit E2, partial [Verrucomicrobiota bacterium]|nr:2-oxo acid dehydrogenase subunit E2 [Verrucomicrobiota bacterium]
MPEIQMPKLSDTMTEGTLIAWKKKKGDTVTAGEVIAEIETDKATMEWESPEDGVLSEIYVDEGAKVEVGQKIAFIGDKDEAPPAPEKKEEPKEKPKAETEQPAPAKEKKKETAPPETEKKPVAKKEAKKAPPKKTEGDEVRVKASPLARRLAALEGLDISQVKGTGDEGRITSTDVHAAIKSKSAAKAPAQKKPSAAVKPGEGTRIQLSGMRKVIAERLVESKGPVPHFYLNIEIDAGPLMAARAELKAGGEGSDTAKITVNDFILKASVDAAVKVPKVNASFDEDAIVQYQDVDLAIAVAIEDGLVTPV